MNETCPAADYRKYLPSDYRKHKVMVSRDVEPYAASVNSYWDGGSISYYTLYRAGRVIEVSKSPGFPKFENQTVQLQPGDVFVKTGIFCGKPGYAFITFICAPKVVAEDCSKETLDTFRAQRNADMGDVVRESLGMA